MQNQIVMIFQTMCCFSITLSVQQDYAYIPLSIFTVSVSALTNFTSFPVQNLAKE